jgi:hypothetical protein
MIVGVFWGILINDLDDNRNYYCYLLTEHVYYTVTTPESYIIWKPYNQ